MALSSGLSELPLLTEGEGQGFCVNLSVDTSSLDIMKLFARFNEVGVTLLIASHDIALIDKLGCRRIELEEGRLMQAPVEDDFGVHFDDGLLPRGGDDAWQ